MEGRASSLPDESQNYINRPYRQAGSRQALYHKLGFKTMASKALCSASFSSIMKWRAF